MFGTEIMFGRKFMLGLTIKRDFHAKHISGAEHFVVGVSDSEISNFPTKIVFSENQLWMKDLGLHQYLIDFQTGVKISRMSLASRGKFLSELT